MVIVLAALELSVGVPLVDERLDVDDRCGQLVSGSELLGVGGPPPAAPVLAGPQVPQHIGQLPQVPLQRLPPILLVGPDDV